MVDSVTVVIVQCGHVTVIIGKYKEEKDYIKELNTFQWFNSNIKWQKQWNKDPKSNYKISAIITFVNNLWFEIPGNFYLF